VVVDGSGSCLLVACGTNNIENETNDYFELVNTPLIQTTVGELYSSSLVHYFNLNVLG
jgi:hypothetical protein